MSPYAQYKLEMEDIMMKAYNKPEFKCTALRFFNVFGEGQRSTGGYRSAVPIFLEQYKSSMPITVTGTGSQTRDWIYVGDVVNAMIESSSAEFNPNMPIYNVGSGTETQVIQVAEALGGEIVNIEKRKEPARSVANINLIKDRLGWAPKTNLLNWIKKTKNEL
jgi:UDP-glucose 4-epimerase